ncbi:hypothetical protein [Dyadobacter sp. BHUBP1]|uniref:hypothetical protein n=1 Tax=Dyadobacter sp. BHUBP1 TaxID=3424178 RepID=UPI003D34E70F
MGKQTLQPDFDLYPDITRVLIPQDAQSVLVQKGFDPAQMQQSIDAAITKGGAQKQKAIETWFPLLDQIGGTNKYSAVLEMARRGTTPKEVALSNPQVGAGQAFVGSFYNAAVPGLLEGIAKGGELILSAIEKGLGTYDQQKSTGRVADIGQWADGMRVFVDQASQASPVSWDSQKGELDLSRLSSLNSWMATIGSVAGYIAPTLVPYVGVAARGLSGTAGVTGALRASTFALSTLQLFPQYQKQALDSGLSYGQASKFALPVAMVSGAIELIGGEALMRGMGISAGQAKTMVREISGANYSRAVSALAGKEFSKELETDAVQAVGRGILQELSDRGVMAGFRAVAKKGGQAYLDQGFAESAEELLQGTAEYFAKEMYNNWVADQNAKALDGKFVNNKGEAVTNALLGSLIGGLMGTGLGMFHQNPHVLDQTLGAFIDTDIREQLRANPHVGLADVKQNMRLSQVLETARQNGQFQDTDGSFNAQTYEDINRRAATLYDTIYGFKDVAWLDSADKTYMAQVASTRESIDQAIAETGQVRQQIAAIDAQLADPTQIATDENGNFPSPELLKFKRGQLAASLGAFDQATATYQKEAELQTGSQVFEKISGQAIQAISNPQTKQLGRRYLKDNMQALSGEQQFQADIQTEVPDAGQFAMDSQGMIRSVRSQPVQVNENILDQAGRTYRPIQRQQYVFEPVRDIATYQAALGSLTQTGLKVNAKTNPTIDIAADAQELIGQLAQAVKVLEVNPDAYDGVRDQVLDGYDLYNQMYEQDGTRSPMPSLPKLSDMEFFDAIGFEPTAQDLADWEQGGAETQEPAEEDSTEQVTPRLPASLAKANPRYGYGTKTFTLDFENDIDKAAYVAAQSRPSKRDADFVKFVMGHKGFDQQQVRTYGQRVRSFIKGIAQDAASGETLFIPDQNPQPNTAESNENPDNKGIGGVAGQPRPVESEYARAAELREFLRAAKDEERKLRAGLTAAIESADAALSDEAAGLRAGTAGAVATVARQLEEANDDYGGSLAGLGTEAGVEPANSSPGSAADAQQASSARIAIGEAAPGVIGRLLVQLTKAFPGVDLEIPETEIDFLSFSGLPLDYGGPAPRGMIKQGKVYLNPASVADDLNTPLHEYGHIWLVWARSNNQQLYEKGIDLISQSGYLKRIRNDPFYKNLTLAAQQEEALARAIGDKGASFITDNRKLDFRNWLVEVFKAIKNYFKTVKVIDGLTPLQLADLAVEDFAASVAEQLLAGTEISGISSAAVDAILNPVIIKKKGVRKDQRPIKNPARLQALSREPYNLRDEVYQYFIGNGLVNEDSLRDLFGEKKYNKEAQHMILIKSGDAPTITEIAHKLWENSFWPDKYTDQDYRNAIEEVLGSFPGVKAMTEYINRNGGENSQPEYDPDFVETEPLEELGYPVEWDMGLLGDPKWRDPDKIHVPFRFTENDGENILFSFGAKGSGEIVGSWNDHRDNARHLLQARGIYGKSKFTSAEKAIIAQVQKVTGFEYLGAKKVRDPLTGISALTSENWSNDVSAINNSFFTGDQVAFLPFADPSSPEKNRIVKTIKNGTALHAKLNGQGTFGKVLQYGLEASFGSLANMESVVSLLDDESGTLKALIRDVKRDGAARRTYADNILRANYEKIRRQMGKFSTHKNASNPDTVEKVQIQILDWNEEKGRGEPRDIVVPVAVAMNILAKHQSQLSMGDAYNTKFGQTHTSLIIDEKFYDDPSDSSAFFSGDIRKGGHIFGSAVFESGSGISEMRLIDEAKVYVLLSPEEMQKLEDRFMTGIGASSPDEEIAYKAIKEAYNNVQVREMLKRESELFLNPDEEFAVVPDYSPLQVVRGMSADQRVNAFSPNLEDARQLNERKERPDAIYIKDIMDDYLYYTDAVGHILGSGRLVHNLKNIQNMMRNGFGDNDPLYAKILKVFERDTEHLQNFKQTQAAKLNKSTFVRKANAVINRYTAYIFRGNFGIAAKQLGTWASAIGQGYIQDRYLNAATPAMLKISRGAITDTGAVSNIVEGTDIGLKDAFGLDTVEAPYIRKLLGEDIADAGEREAHRSRWSVVINRLLYGQNQYVEGIDVTDIQFNKKGWGMVKQLYSKFDAISEDYGMSPIRRGDRAVILGYIEAARLQTDAQVKAGTLKRADQDAEMARIVTETVYATNQMSDIADLTGMQRDSNFITKVIGLYSGQTQKLFNQLLQAGVEYIKFGAQASASDRKAMWNKLRGSLVSNLIINPMWLAAVTGAYSVLLKLLAGDEPEDEEFYFRKFGWDYARYLGGVVPGIAEQVTSYVISHIDNEKWQQDFFEVPGLETVDMAYDGLEDLMAYLGEEDYEKQQKYQDSLMANMTEVLAIGAGVPKIVEKTGSEWNTGTTN